MPLSELELNRLVAAGQLLRPLAAGDRRVDYALEILRDAWRAATGRPAGEARTSALPSAWRSGARDPALLTRRPVAVAPAACHSQDDAVCRTVKGKTQTVIRGGTEARGAVVEGSSAARRGR